MTVSKRLREHLDARNLKYVVVSHSPAFTAQEIAASLHVPGREMAKTVVIKSPDGLALCVLRAMDKVDVERVAAQLGATYARLATEEEFQSHFPDCEMGAMPPFGNLYGIPTLVDEALSLDREIVFNAGHARRCDSHFVRGLRRRGESQGGAHRVELGRGRALTALRQKCKRATDIHRWPFACINGAATYSPTRCPGQYHRRGRA
jgi:Ala-tRNA(Pro) deacylase